MPEILNHPFFLPALAGFGGGLILATLVCIVRNRSNRTARRESEKAAIELIKEHQEKEASLEDELAIVRDAESKHVKEIAQLKSQGLADQQRREEMAQFLGFAKSTLQAELRKHEHVIINSLQSTPRPVDAISAPVPPQIPVQPKPASPFTPIQTPVTDQDDRDFVPLQRPRPAEMPREANFEGFISEPSPQKAESAANTFRAALADQRP